MEKKMLFKKFFKYFVEDWSVSICSYHGFKRFLIVPERLDGYTVTRCYYSQPFVFLQT